MTCGSTEKISFFPPVSSSSVKKYASIIEDRVKGSVLSSQDFNFFFKMLDCVRGVLENKISNGDAVMSSEILRSVLLQQEILHK